MIKVLMLTGANNHDWKRSAPACKDILEKSGKFEVELTENPSAALEDKAKLAGVQLFFVGIVNLYMWSLLVL